MPPKKNPSKGRGRPRKAAKSSEQSSKSSEQSSKSSQQSSKSSQQSSKGSQDPIQNKSGEMPAPNNLPGIKYIPSRHNFSSDESDDSINPQLRSSQPQSMLGSHNTLKQLLSAGNGPSADPRDSMKTPTKRRAGTRPRPVALSSDSPINSASTPISRLKRATAQLNSPDNWAPSPAHFHDDKGNLPPSKRSRSGTKAARLAKMAGVGPGRSAKTVNSMESVKKKPSKSYSESSESPEASKSRPYSEQVSHHLVDLTADDSTDFVPSNKRRSSYNNRGKRQSSVGNGYSSKPHVEVSAEEYYKSLDPAIPEPNQMRQLLTWCFKKSLESTEDPDISVTNDAETAKGIAKIIKQELLADLVNGTISTSWYSLKDSHTELAGKRVVKPNPLNESNKESIEVFKRKLRSLELEKLQWREALESNLRKISGLTKISERIGEQASDGEYMGRINEGMESGIENMESESKGGGIGIKELESENNENEKSRDQKIQSLQSQTDFTSKNLSSLREYLQTRNGGKDILDLIMNPNTRLVDKMEQSAKDAENLVRATLPNNMDQLFHISYQLKQSLGLMGQVEQELLSAQVSKLVKTFMDRNEKTDKWSHVSTKNLMKGIARLDSSKRRI